MREDKKKVTVEYNISNKLVLGYYPNATKYPNKTFEDTQDIGYLEIDQDSWKSRPKQAAVNSNIDGLIKYQKSSDELLADSRREAIMNRKKYLDDTKWYLEREQDEPGTYPEEVKNKRILARAEINKVEKETNIKNITIDFE